MFSIIIFQPIGSPFNLLPTSQSATIYIHDDEDKQWEVWEVWERPDVRG